jgi:hypothetical protein
VPAAGARFRDELRATLARLAAYLAVLAALGYGMIELTRGGLIRVLDAADQQLEWTKPKPAAPVGERYHTSLKPRLRGTVE